MPKDLAALLVEEGAAPPEAVTSALERQREAGGALDTALLEAGVISEEALAPFLARASELPLAPERAWTAADVRARRVFPSRVAERHGLAPFALEGRELSLVATHPVDVGLLDEISFMLSLHLTAHVGPEWRVRELIHRLYGTPFSPRLAALAAAAGVTTEVEAAAHEPEVPPPPPPLTGFERDEGEPLEPLAAALAQAVESLDLGAEEEQPAHGEPEPAGSSEAPARPPPDRTAPPRWSLDDARAALAAAQDRDEVVLAALRYARDFFEFAALFAVTRDAVAGHDALGADGARERARALAVLSADPGIARTVIETRSPYLGPVPRDAAANQAILSGLGRAAPRTALVYPVALRDRIVAVLYADNGQAPVSARRLGDLLLLLSGLGAAFERIIRARKWPPRRSAHVLRDEAPAPKDGDAVPAPAPGAIAGAEAPQRAASTVAAEEPSDPRPTPPPDDGAAPPPPPRAATGTAPAAEREAPPADGSAAEVSAPATQQAESAAAPAAEREASPVPADGTAAIASPSVEARTAPAAESAPSTPFEAALAAVDVDVDAEEEPAPAPQPSGARGEKAASSLEDLERRFFGENDFGAAATGETVSEHREAEGAPSGAAKNPSAAATDAVASARSEMPSAEAMDAVESANEPAVSSEEAGSDAQSSSSGSSTPPASPPEATAPAPAPAALTDRALDSDPAVASAACEALAARRRDPALRTGYEKLRRALLSGMAMRATRAARALGALRDVEAIPLLVQVMETSEPEPARAAADALEIVTLQRHGTDARKWLAWWKRNRGRGRAEWLFSGLTSADRETRVAAEAELREAAADAPIEYSPDMPPPERERAARAWAGWWARSGHVL